MQAGNFIGMRIFNLTMRKPTDAHFVLGVLNISLVVVAVTLEYGFHMQGCFFCWVQRWWLLIMGLFLLKRASWLLILVMAFLSCGLSFYQIAMVIGSTACDLWGGFLPASVFSWLMRFPQCNLLGFLNIPWVVWLLFYQAMVLGYCLRRCTDESAV